MANLTAQWSPLQTVSDQYRVGPPPEFAGGQQLTLFDVDSGRVPVNGHEALALSEQIAVLEQEVRYYRRVVPSLTRARPAVKLQGRERDGETSEAPTPPSTASDGELDRPAGHDLQAASRLYLSREQPTPDRALGRTNRHHSAESPRSKVTRVARWLAEDQHLLDYVSQTLQEQRQLEVRLEALEREHRQVREEVACLFDEEPRQREAVPSIFLAGWFRSALVLLLLASVIIVSVPYLLDWWEGSALSPPTAQSRLTQPGPRLGSHKDSPDKTLSPLPASVDEPVRSDAGVPRESRH